MTLVVPNVSDILMLQYIINKIGQDGNAAPAGGARCLRLYTNNLTPDKTNVIGDFTEASAAGYVPITLAGTSWTTQTVLGVNSAVYSEQTFTFTTGVTVYGYYVTTTEISPKLLWAERFDSPPAPFVLPVDGGEINIGLKLTLN